MNETPKQANGQPKLYLMNSPVLTNHGTFRFEPLADIKAAQALVRAGFESAVGHKGAADLMTADLGVEVPMVRRRVVLERGDRALCLRLKERLPEGEILGKEKLRDLSHEYGLITRVC